MTATISARELRLHLGTAVSKVRRAGPIRMPPQPRPVSRTAQARSPAFRRSGPRVAKAEHGADTEWRGPRSARIGLGLPLALLVALLALLPVAQAQSDLPDGGLTLGTRLANDFADSTLDVLVPVWGDGHNLAFFNPRSTVGDDHEEEINAGVGYRHLLADVALILGANVYYDSHWSSNNNRFDQLGLGLEFLSEWVDARGNWYVPEGGEKSVGDGRVWAWGDVYGEGNGILQKGYGGVERARDGYDAEVGVRLPYIDHWADVRVFVGYYFWDDEFDTDSDLKGPKARVEARVLPGLTVDAEVFEDEGVIGSERYVGCRLHVPFDLGDIIAGRNPFAGARAAFGKDRTPRRFADRLGEMVMRDQYVRMGTGVSGSPARRDVLLSDVAFVDKDAVDSAQAGSFTDPYLSIDAALDSGARNVKVAAATTAYAENVQLPAGTALYGQFVGFGGRVSDPLRPAIHGIEANPTVRLTGDNVTLSGFQITHAATGPSGEIDPVLLLHSYFWVFGTSDVGEVGIYGHDVSGITLTNDAVEDCYRGVLLTPDARANFTATLTDNYVTGASMDGVCVLTVGTGGGDFRLDMSGDYSRNGHNGALIQGTAFVRAAGEFQNLVLDGNGDCGINADVYAEGDGSSALFILRSLAATGNSQTGIRFRANASGANARAEATVSDSRADGNGFDGLWVGAVGHGSVSNAETTASHCHADRNGQEGLVFVSAAEGDQARARTMVASGSGRRNGERGVYVGALASGAASVAEVSAQDCQAGTNRVGMYLAADAEWGDENSTATAVLRDSTADGNQDYGIHLGVWGGKAQGLITNCRANRTQRWDGIEMYVFGCSDTTPAEAVVTGSTMEDNAEHGLFLHVSSMNSVCALSDNRAIRNRSCGLNLQINGNDVNTAIRDCRAEGNGAEGVLADFAGWLPLDLIATFDRVFLNGNGFRTGANGMLFSIDTPGAIAVQGSNCAFTNNQDDGLQIEAAAGAAAYTLDFGGGALGAAGHNSFFGNLNGLGLCNSGSGVVSAGNCYWGRPAPVAGQDYSPSGTVDATNPLVSDPN